MTKTQISAVLVAVVALGGGVGAYFEYHQTGQAPVISTKPLTRGDIVETVVSTGTIQAMRTVDVGAEVSGTISRLYADFDSIVTRGEVIALIDPAVMQDALASAQASLETAKLTLTQDNETLQTDQSEMSRQARLYADGLAMETDRDQARLTVEEDQVQVSQAADAVTAATAAVQSAQTDLDHCTIRSPIDGVVISRDVDEGQVVVSRATPPSLFVLATDLRTVEIVGDVDESDVSRVRPGQVATFTVEAYPGTFTGKVSESRINATTVTNVVTYQTIISADNPQLHLLPGMTATIRIETASVSDVERVPSVALRFRPTNEIFAMFGQSAPPQPRHETPALVNGQGPAIPAARVASASSIDSLFSPVPRRNTTGQVWVIENHRLQAVPVDLGITDGTWTEVHTSDLRPDQEVVTNIFQAKSSSGPGR